MSDEPMYPTCGTYAGVSVHNRNKTPQCDACKHARKMYVRRRRTDDDIRADERVNTAARSRAAWKLVDRHRAEFRRLVQAEMTSKEVRP